MKQFRFVLTVAGLLACSTLAGLAAGADPPPNLLVIHTDEHNFRTLGCYRELLSEEQALMWGDAVVTTPHVDWLAEHGALCTSFYATTPVCSPSRGAFVSGWYPRNTPVVTNNIPMDDRVVTFAEVLRRAGYATGYAGKWHLDGTGKPPTDWTDVTFVRSTGEVPGWLAAVSDRYKLVYSTRDDPWLFDLEEDPDELVNRFGDPACRETVRELSRQLAAYGQRCKDPRTSNAKIRADLAWAVNGTGPYVSSPPAPQVERPARGRAAKPGAGGKRRPRPR